MSRDIPPALADAVDEPVVRPFRAIRIELADRVTAWTGRGTLTFDDSDGNSREWVGAGEVGAIDTATESSDGSATGYKAVLNAIPAELRENVDQQATRGVLLEDYVGALNESYQQVEGVALLAKYRLDTYEITDGGDTLSVQVTGESRGIDQRRPAIKRLSNEYQQRKHPDDKFLEFLSRMTEIPIIWAKAEGGGVAGVGAPSSQGGGFLFRGVNRS